MFYLEFISASHKHIEWLQKKLKNELSVNGHIVMDGRKSVFQLKYAKKEALVIINKMYYNPFVVCLSRKKIKIQKALEVENKQQKIYK